jgi:Fe-S-cluster containining protein
VFENEIELVEKYTGKNRRTFAEQIGPHQYSFFEGSKDRCIFLINGRNRGEAKCEIYDVRPMLCQAYSCEYPNLFLLNEYSNRIRRIKEMEGCLKSSQESSSVNKA